MKTVRVFAKVEMLRYRNSTQLDISACVITSKISRRPFTIVPIEVPWRA
jgi:hypothetical protein